MLFSFAERSRCIWLPYFHGLNYPKFPVILINWEIKTRLLDLNFSFFKLFYTQYLIINFIINVTLYLITPIWTTLKLTSYLKWKQLWFFLMYCFFFVKMYFGITWIPTTLMCPAADSTNSWLLLKLMVPLEVGK